MRSSKMKASQRAATSANSHNLLLTGSGMRYENGEWDEEWMKFHVLKLTIFWMKKKTNKNKKIKGLFLFLQGALDVSVLVRPN